MNFQMSNGWVTVRWLIEIWVGVWVAVKSTAEKSQVLVMSSVVWIGCHWRGWTRSSCKVSINWPHITRLWRDNSYQSCLLDWHKKTRKTNLIAQASIPWNFVHLIICIQGIITEWWNERILAQKLHNECDTSDLIENFHDHLYTFQFPFQNKSVHVFFVGLSIMYRFSTPSDVGKWPKCVQN